MIPFNPKNGCGMYKYISFVLQRLNTFVETSLPMLCFFWTPPTVYGDRISGNKSSSLKV